MKAISTAHQRQLASARQNLLGQQERNRQRDETAIAKQIQRQTGCSWSDAIKSVIGSAS